MPTMGKGDLLTGAACFFWRTAGTFFGFRVFVPDFISTHRIFLYVDFPFFITFGTLADNAALFHRV